MREFLHERSSPITLATLRIATFVAIFFSVNVEQTSVMASLPPELLRLPTAGGQLLGLFQFSPTAVSWAACILKLICLIGILGIASRTTSLLATVLGLYVLGIPECFGKVDHYHHILWISALLSVSPCGDALSVDSLILGRGGFAERLVGPAPDMRYGLPIRFVWLLIGALYFFRKRFRKRNRNLAATIGIDNALQSGSHAVRNTPVPNSVVLEHILKMHLNSPFEAGQS